MTATVPWRDGLAQFGRRHRLCRPTTLGRQSLARSSFAVIALCPAVSVNRPDIPSLERPYGSWAQAAARAAERLICNPLFWPRSVLGASMMVESTIRYRSLIIRHRSKMPTTTFDAPPLKRRNTRFHPQLLGKIAPGGAPVRNDPIRPQHLLSRPGEPFWGQAGLESARHPLHARPLKTNDSSHPRLPPQKKPESIASKRESLKSTPPNAYLESGYWLPDRSCANAKKSGPLVIRSPNGKTLRP